jgi:anti-anti-sigma factor
MSHKTTMTQVPYRETVREYLTVRQVRERPDLERVNPVGDIDLYTVGLLRNVLADADRREVPNVLVDLSRVDFLALVGVRVLRAAGERRAAARRRLVVSAPTTVVQRVLGFADATGELEIYVNLPSARSALDH